MAIVGRDSLDDVHGQCGLSHGRPGREDQQFAALQPVEHVVQFAEIGFDAAVAAAGDHLVNVVQHGFHLLGRITDLFLGDVEDAFLGMIQHEFGLLVRAHRHRGGYRGWRR